MNKQIKPKKYVTVQVDATLVEQLRSVGKDPAQEIDVLLRTRAARPRKPVRISKRTLESMARFLEKHGTLSDEFNPL
jgi:hypothetical protein